MATPGRTIRLFLVDGAPTGILTAEIMNWTGHVLTAPRSRIVDVLQRPEIGRTGIYFLVGADPDSPGQSLVYIGESDNVADRLKQHNADESKGFWEATCIVTNKDANLTKAHVRYLESRLIQITKSAARARLRNGTAPEYDYLPESDKSDMEYIIEQIQTLLPVLGMDFLRLTPQTHLHSKTGRPSDQAVAGADARKIQSQNLLGAYTGISPEFIFSDAQGTVRASAIEAEGEMIILKGSEARQQETSSLAYNVRVQRQQLIQSGRLVPSDKAGILRFAEDVAFSSPSAASQAIMGTSRNGRTDWKVAGTGESYADWQESLVNRLALISSAISA